MLLQRLIFGALLIAGLAAIFWTDIRIAESSIGQSDSACFRHGSIIPLAVVLLALFGTLEMLNLTRAAGYMPMGRTVVVGVVAINVIAWLVPAIYPESRIGALEWELIALLLGSMGIGIVQVLRHRTERGIGDISVSMMILIYMGLLPSMITALRASLPDALGAYAVLLFIAVVKCTDIGAYFTGLAIGKTKLIPAISPGKTVEGLAGGMVLATLATLLLNRLLPLGGSQGVSPISPLQAVLFGAVMAMLGQFGDLMESVFKRDATAKDSGRVVPAFGGILDLLDSPVFAAPLGYLLLRSWLGEQ